MNQRYHQFNAADRTACLSTMEMHVKFVMKNEQKAFTIFSYKTQNNEDITSKK